MTSYQYRFWEIDPDIEFLNFRKNEPKLTDQYGHSIQGEYFQGWQAIYQYVYNVLVGIRPAGKSEIAACERFVYDLNRKDLVFDKDDADLVFLLCSSLRHPKGDVVGQKFFIMGWMGFCLAQIFAWYYSDEARETLRGDRRFMKSYVAVARGNSKTVLSAAFCILQALTTTNGSPIITTSGPVQKQSRLAFEDVGKMIRSATPSVRRQFRVLQNEIRILASEGKIIATSSESSTLDGLRVVGAVCDELHAHRDSSIVDVLSTGMGSSRDPHLMMITTAGVDLDTYGKEMMDLADEIAQNVFINDRFLSCVYKLDKENEDRWNDEELWKHANPTLGHAVSLEALRCFYTEATRNAKARANFLTKHCNVYVSFNEDSFVDANELEACKDHALNIDDYAGRDCYLGLDLASVSDLSSLVYIFPNDNGGVDVFQKSYIPDSAFKAAQQTIQDRYMAYSRDGELIITPTLVTDFDYIVEDILRAHEDYNVKALSIDGAAGGIKFASDLEDAHGIEAVSVKQGYGLSTSAITAQTLIKSKSLRYSSELFQWCMGNARQKTGAYDDICVVRPTQREKKIDACVAFLIGMSQAILRDNSESVYETQDFRYFKGFLCY
ncbi:terminase large subunit [Edwardsiella tarda]|uniref:terminase large subunit n=1 Tax=Edwardsiella tarda TaxID=636 RepID=UPI00083A9C05|nr:terminase TerL endonuclease subunit [Edwardsiella tarda]